MCLSVLWKIFCHDIWFGLHFFFDTLRLKGSLFCSGLALYLLLAPCSIWLTGNASMKNDSSFLSDWLVIFSPWSFPLSDTLERQTQSPSVYGTTRRSTKSRAQGSWAVSASCPTLLTDSKTLAVSRRLSILSAEGKMGHWCLVPLHAYCSLCPKRQVWLCEEWWLGFMGNTEWINV